MKHTFENDTISSGEYRRDFLLIAAVILAAAAAVFFFQVKNRTSGTVYAIVEQDSKELMRAGRIVVHLDHQTVRAAGNGSFCHRRHITVSTCRMGRVYNNRQMCPLL